MVEKKREGERTTKKGRRVIVATVSLRDGLCVNPLVGGERVYDGVSAREEGKREEKRRREKKKKETRTKATDTSEQTKGKSERGTHRHTTKPKR